MLKQRKREREECSSTFEVDVGQSSDYRPKKLRLKPLSRRERTATGCLDDAWRATSEDAALEFIQEFSESFLELLKPSECQAVCEKLIEIVATRKEAEIRERGALYLRQVLENFVNALSTQELDTEINNILRLGETSGGKLDCVLTVWICLCQKKILPPASKGFIQLQKLTEESLDSDSWRCRALSLKLLTLCCRESSGVDCAEGVGEEERRRDLERTLCRSLRDSDSRVRAAAGTCLLEIAEAVQSDGWNLGLHCYPEICSLLPDAADTVRITALRLVKFFSLTYPEEKVVGRNRSAELRLVDDAFSKLCDAMHDAVTLVRAEAATHLGSIDKVSDTFLYQTLDKKLMSKMKFFKTAKKSRLLQEWSTGRRFGEDIPAEKAEEDSESMIPSGACGAFVTGLEDEYMTVRLASVRSLSQLATGRREFGVKAVDFLADMFNDEIESIRLVSINCIRPLVKYCQLNEDQMETILNVLDDAATDSRGALRELISHCRLATVSCLKMTIHALLNNLLRYPADKISVWDCMKALGRSHAAMIQPLVNGLLGFHPFFDTPEPPIENATYMAKLIAVLNAASKCPSIIALFPNHTKRHYRFLRDSSPHLVAELDLFKRRSDVEVEGVGEVESLFKNVVEKMELSETLHLETRREMADLISKDLSNVSQLNAELAPASEFLRASCRFRILLETVLERSLFPDNLSKTDQSPKIWDELWSVYCCLNDLFTNKDREVRVFIEECSIRLIAARFVFSSVSTSIISVFISRLDHYRQLMSEESRSSEQDFLDRISSLADSAADSDLSGKPLEPTLKRSLLESLKLSRLRLPSMSSLRCLREKESWISDPTSDSTTTLRFVAGLVSSIELTASFRNFAPYETDDIRIRIVYPDMKETLFHPRKTDFKIISSEIIRLRTDVLLSSYSWSEKAPVTLELVEIRKEDDMNLMGCVCGGKAKAWYHPTSTRRNLAHTVDIHLFPKLKC